MPDPLPDPVWIAPGPTAPADLAQQRADGKWADRVGDTIEATVPAEWPEFASTEECDRVWVRADLPVSAANDVLDCIDFPGVGGFTNPTPVTCIYLPESPRFDGWELREAHPEEVDQAHAYVRWDVTDVAAPEFAESPSGVTR